MFTVKPSWLISYCLVVITLMASTVWAAQPPSHSKSTAEKVTLQLKWFNQFQFAGYYAAIEQGYYAEEGLDVEIRERVLEKNVVQQVTSNEAEYGVGDSGLLSHYAQGEPIVALAAIFQHNPLVFMTRQDSGITSASEIKGKRVMSDLISFNEAQLFAMLSGTGLTEKDYTLIPQTNDYTLLVQNKVDAISGYLTDQPFFFKEKGLKINIINPKNYDIDFYGDMLFTSQKELQSRPDRVDRFRRASLKGWQYALTHPEELIQIIHKKYRSKLSIEHLRFEAIETKKLIMPDMVLLGTMEYTRLKKIADTYAGAGFNRPLTETELKVFMYTSQTTDLNLTDTEKAWLNAHPVIKVGVDSNFAPYEWIDRKGHYVGMAADYMQLLENKLGVRFEIIKNKPWDEILNMAKRGELDMLSCAVNTAERSQYLTFSLPYKTTNAIIIDNGSDAFIGSLEHLSGKRVAVEKGYFMQEMLQKDYPQIQLISASNTENALKLVANGSADAYVGDAGSTNYIIKKHNFLHLRFSGETVYNSQHSIAVVKSEPVLASIINKAMVSISQNEADAIFNRWLGLRIEQGIKPETLLKYGLAFTFLLLLFAYWAYRMKREISIRKTAETREQARSHIMEKLAQGAPLTTILEAIVKSVEQLHPKMLCSILLLDREGKHLHNSVAPSLPDFYNAAINGTEIGIGVGSCGTAAATSKLVIVEDIQTHPYWIAYKALAAKADLASCWSQPIFSSTGQVLGTFAIYHHEINAPTQADIATIEQSAHLAGIAIERKQAENLLIESEHKLSSILDGVDAYIYLKDTKGCYTFANRAVRELFNTSMDEIIGHSDERFFDAKTAAKIHANDTLVLAEGQTLKIEEANTILNNGKSSTYISVKLPLREESGSIYALCGISTDITERKQMEKSLLESEARYRVLVETASEAIVVAQGNTLKLVNKKALEISGYSEEELLSLPFIELVHVDDRQFMMHNYQKRIQGEPISQKYQIRLLRKDKSVRWAEMSGAKVDWQGQPATFNFVTDITERIQTEQQLRIAATAFESQEGILITDAHNVILRVNQTFTTITGYTSEEVIGKTPRLLHSGRQDKAFYQVMWENINKTGTWVGEIWNRRKNGEIYPEHLTITAVKDAQNIVTNYVATFIDITASKAATEEIKYLAFYDSLTELPNRRLLMDRLQQALATSARSGQKGALLFLDLDYFKNLNDTLGHGIGDLLLQQVSTRLMSCIREGDTVARIGGDEFVILLEDLNAKLINAATQTEVIGKKILTVLNQPYYLDTHEYLCSASIGATLIDNHQFKSEEIIKQADIAMYEAKNAGRNTLRFFDPIMQEVISTRVVLEHDLRNAIVMQQFQLYYQIQVDSAGHAVGAEALIRWFHPTRGMISPLEFIPLAEETGLILPIGQWVLETACAQLKAWQHNSHTQHLTLSVNVSAKQFLQADFTSQVQHIVHNAGIDPILLKLELTESVLLNNIDNIISNMRVLKEMKIHFSLDDFGTGYSSLQYLKTLPIYQLKIDQSFVRNIANDISDQAIVRTIIAMAQTLNLNVIAEGVETEEQRQLLHNNGCHTYQGYLFSKPVPIDEFEALCKPQ